MAEITIELFGIPRQRAGCARMAIHADTVADALRQLELHCSGLSGLLLSDGSLSPHYLLSLDGARFVGDLRERVLPETRLLLFSADAGG